MPKDLITNDPEAQRMLRDRFIAHRWRYPYVTSVRESKAEAHSRSWAEMQIAIEQARRRRIIMMQLNQHIQNR